jgi:selenocysteine-specific elongation factor
MVVMHHDPFQAMGLRILDLLYAFHKENSLKRGRGREELRGKAASASEKAFNRCLDLLAKEGKVVIDKNLVRLPSHKVELQEDQTRTKKRLEQELLDSGFQPPSPQEAFDHLSISSQTGGEMMQLLISEGVLIRIKEKIIYHKTNLVKAEDTLQQYLKANKEITAAQFRDILGISRKYAIPLLEHFDNKRITFRKGDVRVLRNAN